MRLVDKWICCSHWSVGLLVTQLFASYALTHMYRQLPWSQQGACYFTTDQLETEFLIICWEYTAAAALAKQRFFSRWSSKIKQASTKNSVCSNAGDVCCRYSSRIVVITEAACCVDNVVGSCDRRGKHHLNSLSVTCSTMVINVATSDRNTIQFCIPQENSDKLLITGKHYKHCFAVYLVAVLSIASWY